MAAAALIALALVIAPPPSPPPFTLPRLEGTVVVDGEVSEAAWEAIAPLPLTTLYPSFDGPLSERTEIRLGHDARFLYASIRAFDAEPHRILATTLYRDRWVSDDEFALILDTLDDGQNAAMFLVTPAGVRVDNQLTNDAVPGRGPWMNRDWNVVWDAAARITGDGWFAEMRIPFASLSFRAPGGEARMRLKTYRYLRRRGENQMFPPTRPDAGAAPHFQPSLGIPVLIRGVQPSTPLLLSPFVSARAAVGPTGSPSAVEAGLDARWTPRPATVVDATLNTDFAQVEADDEQLNLTRFSLFFPEKRPFFQERAGLFSVSTGGDANVFYSRRIGLDDAGRTVPLKAGVRVGSRVAGWDLGVLNAWTGGEAGDRNVGVVRALRPAGRFAQAGAMVTHSVGAGVANFTWAVDGTAAIGRTGRATLTWAQSAESSRPNGLEAGRLFARVQRDTEQGLGYSAEYRWSGRDYAPGLGFVSTVDFQEGIVALRQRWRSGPQSWIRSHGWSTRVTGRRRRADHGVDELSTRTEWNVELANNLFAGGRLQTLREDVSQPFELLGALRVSPGRYDATWLSAFVFTPEDRRIRGSATVEHGSFYGGTRSTLRLSPLWNQSRYFEVSADLDRTAATVPGQSAVTAWLVRGRVRVAASSRLFADVFVQRNTGRRLTAINGRLRLNLSEGHDLWLVVDGVRDGLLAEDVLARALTVKYVRLFLRG